MRYNNVELGREIAVLGAELQMLGMKIVEGIDASELSTLENINEMKKPLDHVGELHIKVLSFMQNVLETKSE